MNLSACTGLSVWKQPGQNYTNRWNHKGWVVCEDTLLGVPVGAERELELKGRTLCLQCQAGREPCVEDKCWGRKAGSAEGRPKLACSDCGHHQVGVGLRAFWKSVSVRRVTEKELRWESWGLGQGREDVPTLCPSAHTYRPGAQCLRPRLVCGA